MTPVSDAVEYLRVPVAPETAEFLRQMLGSRVGSIELLAGVILDHKADAARTLSRRLDALWGREGLER